MPSKARWAAPKAAHARALLTAAAAAALVAAALLTPQLLSSTDAFPAPFWGPSPASLASSEAESCHRVKRLPGWGRLRGLRMYSGYVSVAEERQLFYALVEAEKAPEEAPVVLWLTGGPGCSSVGTAWIGEHGPFLPRPGSTSKLMRNRHSYHRFANMIYLDAPAFTGFSYSNSSEDKEVGDDAMAQDVVSFIDRWRDLFPGLANNPFFLAGESYAGHYVPHITWKLLEEEKRRQLGAAHAGPAGPAGLGASKKKDKDDLDFKGTLLGNPSTDSEYDNEGRMAYWWSHGLISEDVRKEVEDSCDFKEVIITPQIEVKTRKESKECEKAVTDAIKEIGPIDIQDVFGDKCKKELHDDTDAESPLRALGHWLHSCMAPPPPPLGRVDPCVTQEGESYLKRRDVQDALHANLTGQLDWEYQGCTEGEIFKYSVDDQLESQLPMYRKIMEAAPKLRILIYTGDADAMVPLTGTRRWVFELGREEGKKEKKHWKHWEDPDGQVGGYTEEYEGFTFATVRKAGHEAPYTAKVRTEHLYRTWLAGKDLVD